jgi:hypothetical protein
MIVRNCKVCKQQINPKRLEILPNTYTCVNCSDSSRKGAITVMKGEGDHTWIETIQIDDPETYNRYAEEELKFRKSISNSSKAEMLDDDDDEGESFNEIDLED